MHVVKLKKKKIETGATFIFLMNSVDVIEKLSARGNVFICLWSSRAASKWLCKEFQ